MTFIQPTYQWFSAELDSLCSLKALRKGYSDGGINGRNPLYEFIESHIGSVRHAHALGEIVYKVVRYAKKEDPEDLLKIAAWAWLIYKHSVQGVSSMTTRKKARKKVRK